MSVTNQTIAEIVRKRLSLASSIDVLWSIPEGLERLGRKIAANPRKRHLLMTDRSTEVALTDGAVEISAVTGALREYLHHGTIWYKNDDDEIYDYPLQPLSNPAFLNAPKTFGNSYYHYWIDGGTVRTRNFDINQPDELTGSLLFLVPRRPTITDIDANPELIELLVEKVIEVMTNPRNDSAEDGEN